MGFRVREDLAEDGSIVLPVTVKNTGTEDTTVDFSYHTERTDVQGDFSQSARIALTTGQEETVYLVLSGKPSEELDKTVIGNVTVRIGGE